jgi:hypothetical protein
MKRFIRPPEIGGKRLRREDNLGQVAKRYFDIAKQCRASFKAHIEERVLTSASYA